MLLPLLTVLRVLLVATVSWALPIPPFVLLGATAALQEGSPRATVPPAPWVESVLLVQQVPHPVLQANTILALARQTPVSACHALPVITVLLEPRRQRNAQLERTAQDWTLSASTTVSLALLGAIVWRSQQHQCSV